jgi:tyrosinase
MPHVRRNVWKLPAGDKTLEWYGKAVGELQRRPITDVTSWWSLGAMHGFEPQAWQGFGFVKPSTPLPAPPIQKKLWSQCQHQTWYFLPWHRGYLAAFETIIRDTVKKLGGPADWSLPYWNYSDAASQRELPPAFAKATLPGGGKNFLHVAQRYGTDFPNVQSPLVLASRVVFVAQTLREKFFQGFPTGSPGFGGVKTAFHHGDNAGTFGVLETQPHGGVHVAVGGGNLRSNNPVDLGLMTNPDTAALDPIFWLHHANIDRLWKLWLRHKRQPGDPVDAFKNPTSPDWLDGPVNREFWLPRVDGTLFKFAARDVLDTTAAWLDYVYDDETVTPAPAELLAQRFETLGASPQRAQQLAGTITMAPPKPGELLGANTGPVRLNSELVESHVRLDRPQRQALTEALSVDAAAAPRAPDRVYLALENVRSPSDAGLFYVYVNLPQGADPEKNPDNFVGTLSLFGVRKASAAQGPNAGNGVNAAFDITPIVDKMHAQGGLADTISVKLIPGLPGGTSDDVSIGRISVYRQSH